MATALEKRPPPVLVVVAVAAVPAAVVRPTGEEAAPERV
jgi:hypothetical protein